MPDFMLHPALQSRPLVAIGMNGELRLAEGDDLLYDKNPFAGVTGSNLPQPQQQIQQIPLPNRQLPISEPNGRMPYTPALPGGVSQPAAPATSDPSLLDRFWNHVKHTMTTPMPMTNVVGSPESRAGRRHAEEMERMLQQGVPASWNPIDRSPDALYPGQEFPEGSPERAMVETPATTKLAKMIGSTFFRPEPSKKQRTAREREATQFVLGLPKRVMAGDRGVKEGYAEIRKQHEAAELLNQERDKIIAELGGAEGFQKTGGETSQHQQLQSLLAGEGGGAANVHQMQDTIANMRLRAPNMDLPVRTLRGSHSGQVMIRNRSPENERNRELRRAADQMTGSPHAMSQLLDIMDRSLNPAPGKVDPDTQPLSPAQLQQRVNLGTDSIIQARRELDPSYAPSSFDYDRAAAEMRTGMRAARYSFPPDVTAADQINMGIGQGITDAQGIIGVLQGFVSDGAFESIQQAVGAVLPKIGGALKALEITPQQVRETAKAVVQAPQQSQVQQRAMTEEEFLQHTINMRAAENARRILEQTQRLQRAVGRASY